MRQPSKTVFGENSRGNQTFTWVFILGAGYFAASMMGNSALAQECPAGYRLHYQGFCINKADELSDAPNQIIRTVEPTGSPEEYQTDVFEQLSKTGYKFSNMEDGEYCKNAYIRISRSKARHPVAFALGAQSCGFSDEKSVSLDTAKANAMTACEKHTDNCRIIFPEEQ